MACLIEVLPIILYLLVIVLVGFLIVFVYRAIKTLSKVEEVVDDVNKKSKKLDNLFDIVDNAADGLSQVSDIVVNGLSSFIGSLFKKNKKKEGDKDE